MYRLKNERGIILISVLILITILLMIATSMTLIATQSYNLAGMADKRAKALRAAEAGVEYAFYELNKNTAWNVASDLSVDLHFAQGETSKLIASGFSNNLKGSTKSGTTPPYSAEVISEGYYGGQTVRVKALFARDDLFPYPIASDGDLLLTSGYSTNTTIKGKDNSPGRAHSNERMMVWLDNPDTLDLNEGFLSSVMELNYSSHTLEPLFDYREFTQPSQVADIDIENIILSHKGGCHTIAGDTFYLIGYFEYSSGNYCIPHEGPDASAPQTTNIDYWDQTCDDMIYTHPYQYGIASFSEDSVEDFMNNYRELQNIGPNVTRVSLDVGRNQNNSRDLLDYYPSVNFAEIGTSEWDNMMTSLGMSYTTEVVDDITIVTLILNDDTYSSGSLGFYDTMRFDCQAYCLDTGSGGGDIGDARVVSFIRPKVKLDLNNNNIFAEGELALPTIDNGAAVTADSAYLFPAYDSTMTVLAENDIALCLRDQTPMIQKEEVKDVTFKGVLYAKDNIYFNDLSRLYDYNISVNFMGSIVALDKVKNNNEFYPRTINYGQNVPNIVIQPSEVDNINIIHTDDGLDSLVGVRVNSFHVRKVLCAVVN